MVRETFHEELAGLKGRVLEMAELARSMLTDGVRSLMDLDQALAEEVLERKDRLAKFDEIIEEEALLLVARQQPMARDLRSIGAALKLITYINRVGRYGKDIAQITTQWKSDGHLANLVNIPHMGTVLERMFDAVLEAYETETDVDLDQLLAWEDELDALRWSVFRECLTYMAEDPHNIEAFSYYMMIARYMERCGDNVCKMAEKTHYLVVGEHIQIR